MGPAAVVVMEGTAHSGGMKTLEGSGSGCGSGGGAAGGGGGGGGNPSRSGSSDRLVAEVVTLLRPHCPAAC